MEPYVASALLEAGFRQAVMGSYPRETVTSLPEYSDQDPDFWDSRFLAAILHPVTFPDGAAVPPRPHPWGCNAEEDVLCYPDDLYPNM